MERSNTNPLQIVGGAIACTEQAWTQERSSSIDMVRPRLGEEDLRRMKRLAPPPQGCPGCDSRWEQEPTGLSKIVVHVDSDWNGCKTSRKSTSGEDPDCGMDARGDRLQSLWRLRAVRPSTTHSFEELPRPWVWRLCRTSWAGGLPIDIKIDSAASKLMGCWLGLGKQRYIEVMLLWVLESVRRTRLRIIKIPGTTNLADILTKPKSMDNIRARLVRVCVSIDLERRPDASLAENSPPNPAGQAVECC